MARNRWSRWRGTSGHDGRDAQAAEALRDVQTIKPDVILVELNVPDRDGLELLAALRIQVPSAKLLVVSCYDDEFRVAEALHAGAQGYLVRNSEYVDVIDGIRRIFRGGAPLSQPVTGGWATLPGKRKPAPRDTAGPDVLTPRERQVLALLAAGKSTRETAARLDLRLKTVETHRARIYAKLGWKRAAELSKFAKG